MATQKDFWIEELIAMRAVWFESFGAAEDVLQVGERERPAVGSGEVLVRMHTSGINPSDSILFVAR